MNKEICGHCVFYDMWCGGCLNPESSAFRHEEYYILSNPHCSHFELEESYRQKYNKE